MDLVWLEDFLTIVEAGGFSRAAESRNVTQPALSRRIKALEEWLGTPLFHRTTHSVVLTPAGETFRRTADDVFRRISSGKQEALKAARRKAETVDFAATHALSQTFFPQWIRKESERGFDAAVQLVSANFASCEKMLIEAQVHFLLCHYHPALASKLEKGRFQRAVLDQEVLIPITAPAQKVAALKRGKRKPLPRYSLESKDDSPIPFLGFHAGSGIGRIVSSFLAGKEAAQRLVPSFSAPTMLVIEMARRGEGISWTPSSLVKDDIAAGRLMRAGRSEWDIHIDICLFRSRSRMTPAVEAFWSKTKKNAR